MTWCGLNGDVVASRFSSFNPIAEFMPTDSFSTAPVGAAFDDILAQPLGVTESTSSLPERPAAEAKEAQAQELRIKHLFSHVCETSDAVADRLQRIKAASNPLLEAAEPLLLTLARMPELELDGADVPLLHALLVREIETFRMLCTQADVARDHVVAASFSLCTALDEAAGGTAWGGAAGNAGAAGKMAENSGETAPASQLDSGVGAWAGQMLAAHFHADTAGGTKMFLLIGRLLTLQPQGYIDLLEVLYRIISLGFEGQYRAMPDGRRQHETVRQRMATQIVQARPQVARELSPHWQGAGAGQFKLLRSLPVWVMATVLGLALLGMFSYYKFQLLQRRESLVGDIVALGQMTAPAMPVQEGVLQLAPLLKEEIEQGLVSVSEDGRQAHLVFGSDALFADGLTNLQPHMRVVLGRLATAMASLPVSVQISGHTDNVPILLPRFPHNQALSEQRAASVAEALQAGGVSMQQMQISGQGEKIALADNASAAGRARNRRVEIRVSLSGSSSTSDKPGNEIAAPQRSTSSVPAAPL
jgi:type VI secretion system protein ImpK